MTARLPDPVFAVSVDLDPLRMYARIHGLPGAGTTVERGPDPVWQVAVPRFAALFAELGIHATFFVVAEDLADPVARAAAHDLVRQGHELASHSFSHPYDLVRRDAPVQRAELFRADADIRTVTGAPVAGYRAPGYSQSPAVQATLAELGYDYDSSAFPCPAYVAAKAAIIAAKRLRGRLSQSILHAPASALGGRGPSVVTTPHGALWSLPISVTPVVRFPLIGTALTALGRLAVPLLGPVVERMAYVNIEMHGVDLLGLDDDRLPAEFAVQPDLRVPVSHKRAVFRELFARGRTTHRTLPLAALVRVLDDSNPNARPSCDAARRQSTEEVRS